MDSKEIIDNRRVCWQHVTKISETHNVQCALVSIDKTQKNERMVFCLFGSSHAVDCVFAEVNAKYLVSKKPHYNVWLLYVSEHDISVVNNG